MTSPENPDYQEFKKSVDRARLIPRTEVVLLDEDLEPSVERIFGSDEYEYLHKIPAAKLLHFSSCLE